MKGRRGTAIVENKKGILLTAMSKGGVFLLPGGQADRGEPRFRAAIRELQEETSLLANSAEIIFKHESRHNKHTVVLIKARGTPKPKREVKVIEYYNHNKKIKMSQGTKDIIKKYLLWKSKI